MTETVFARGAQLIDIGHRQTSFPPRSTYHIVVTVLHEPDGGFSVCVPSLPGAHSQGESYKEAIANITDALHGLILEYCESGNEIPWVADDGERPADSLDRGILVHV